MNQKKNSNLKNNQKDVDSLDYIDVIILCGGLGTRLKPLIFEEPKVLAKIGDQTFLDILIDNISFYGSTNIILCIGHLKDNIKRYFGHCHDYYEQKNRIVYNYNDCRIKFSEEGEPLGTGGALKNAELLINSDPFIVMNGDSICNVDFRKLLDFHKNKKALLSMVLARSMTSRDYGTVILDNSSRIINFNEKPIDNNETMINAGIYIMQKDIFSYMPDRKTFSLEYDLFPKLCNDICYGFVTNSEIIDIGTPERYIRAIEILSTNSTNK